MGPRRFSAVSGVHSKVYESDRGSDDRHDLRIGDPATARRDDHVPDQRQLLGELALLLPEVRLTLLAEDLADRAPFPALDLEVEVEKGATQSVSATACPTVVFPDPGSPTRIRCGFDGSAAEPGCDVRKVGIIVPFRFADGIAAELLQERVREDEREHRFGDDPHRRHRGHVAALGDRRCGLRRSRRRPYPADASVC